MSPIGWKESSRPGLFDAGNLLDDPDGQRHEDDDDGGESEPPTPLAPLMGFFRSHGRMLITISDGPGQVLTPGPIGTLGPFS
jgi:hypothetical protein